MVEKKVTLKLMGKYARERLQYFGPGVVLDCFDS